MTSVSRCFCCGYPVSHPFDIGKPVLYRYRHHTCGDKYGEGKSVIHNPAVWLEEWCFELEIDIRDLL